MFVPSRPLGIFLMIVIFLVLTVITAIRYSHNESGVQAVQEQPWYRLANVSWQASENFFTRLLPNKNKSKQADYLEENKLPISQSRNIQLIRSSSDWQLILQNKNGIIFEKTWPRLFKSKN